MPCDSHMPGACLSYWCRWGRCLFPSQMLSLAVPRYPGSNVTPVVYLGNPPVCPNLYPSGCSLRGLSRSRRQPPRLLSASCSTGCCGEPRLSTASPCLPQTLYFRAYHRKSSGKLWHPGVSMSLRNCCRSSLVQSYW